MDIDLHDELERCFGDGPGHRPLQATLDAGHRALRRRRRQWVVGGIATVALAAALCTWQATATPSADRPPVATPGREDAGPDDFRWRDQDPIPQFRLEEDQAFFDVDGMLVVRPGATVEKRIDDPLPADYADRTVALITRTDGQTYWTYAHWLTEHTSGSASVRPQETHGATFDAWVAAEAARTELGEPRVQYVAFRTDGTLRGAGGAQILAQTADVPDRIAPTGSQAAVALVAVGGARLCAYARVIDGRDPEYIYLNGTQLGPDLPGCVANISRWDSSADD